MNKQLVIHVGMHKTGSTAIQQALYGAHLPSHICYPDFGDANHTFGIIDTFAEDPVAIREGLNRQLPEDEVLSRGDVFRERLTKCAQDPEIQKVILSAEGFLRLGVSGAGRVREFFERYGFEPEIYAYVRPLDEFLRSNFQERLKRSQARISDLEKMINYKGWLSRLEQAFPMSQPHLIKYDRKMFRDGSVVADFGERIGLEGLEETPSGTNRSLTLSAVRLLYTYRHWQEQEDLHSLDQRKLLRLIRRLSEVDGPAFAFSSDLIDSVIEKRIDQIREVESRLDGSLTEHSALPLEHAVSSEKDLLAHDALGEQWLKNTSQQMDIEVSKLSNWNDWVGTQMDAIRQRG